MKCYYCGNNLPENAYRCEKCEKSQLITQNLIDDAIRGDQDAFTRIYMLTYKSLGDALKCMVKDEDSRQDILQETYLKAYLNLSSVRDSDKFYSWLRRIAHNEAASYLKARNKILLKEVPYDLEADWNEEEYRTENLPELQLDRKETARLTKKITGCLSREQRIVVELFYEDEYKVSEIAQMLNVSENTVKSRLYYARQKLEVRVRKLEKQGISLRGLAPIPFVTALFRENGANPREASATAPVMSEALREQLARAAQAAEQVSALGQRIGPEQANGLVRGVSRLSEAGGAILTGAKMLFAATGKGIAVNIAAIAVAVGVAGGIAFYQDNRSADSALETTQMEAALAISMEEAWAETEEETEEETEAQTETQPETAAAAQNTGYEMEETVQETEAATTLGASEKKKQRNRMSIYSETDDNGEDLLWHSDLRRETIAEVTFLGSLEDAPADAWDVSENGYGAVLAWVTDAGAGLYHLYVAADGGVVAPAECRFMFGNFTSVKKITFGENFDTSDVTSMQHMFTSCGQLEEVDIERLDTSCVTDMSYMFFAAGLESLNLSNFDTSGVVTMEEMFSGCTALTDLNLESFDTSKVTDMNHMFGNCDALTELDLSGFDTSAVTNFDGMFCASYSLKELNLGGFDTSSALTMSNMFAACTSLTAIDLSSFDTSKVAYMSWMFWNCEALEHLDVSGFDTSHVTDMSYMFSGCLSLTELDVSGFDTSLVTDMSYMFENCSALRKLDLSGFDWSAVIYRNGMLDGTSAAVTY